MTALRSAPTSGRSLTVAVSFRPPPVSFHTSTGGRATLASCLKARGTTGSTRSFCFFNSLASSDTCPESTFSTSACGMRAEKRTSEVALRVSSVKCDSIGGRSARGSSRLNTFLTEASDWAGVNTRLVIRNCNSLTPSKTAPGSLLFTVELDLNPSVRMSTTSRAS